MSETFNFEPFLIYWKNHRGASLETIKAYRSDLKFFKGFLEACSVDALDQISHGLIHDYIEHMRKEASNRSGKLGLAEATIARRLAAVSSFLEYARANGYSSVRNPLSDFKNRWKRNNKPKPVDEGELSKLLAAIDSKRDLAMIMLFLSSGLRLTEMAGLNLSSIRGEQIREEINGETKEFLVGAADVIGKGNKPRTVFFDIEALRAWVRYQDERKDDSDALFLSVRRASLSARAMQERLQHWCKKAEIPHVNIHRLRHTYATRLINGGINIIHLQALLGHSSLATTQNYAKLHDNTLAMGYFSAMEWVR